MFVIAAEGRITELQYFAQLENANVHIKCLRKGNKNSPRQVLNRMREHLRNEGLRASDQAWIVIDADQWSDDDIRALHEWTCGSENRGLAVSNPKFELWLLLHFEDARGVATAGDCDRRLRRHLPDYAKTIDRSKFPRDSVRSAIARARAKDTVPPTDWPHNPPGTTVYRVVERVLESAADA